MRKKNQKQMPLMINRIDHPHAMELESISKFLMITLSLMNGSCKILLGTKYMLILGPRE